MVPHSSICAKSKSAEFPNSPDFPSPGAQAAANSGRHDRHPSPATNRSQKPSATGRMAAHRPASGRSLPDQMLRRQALLNSAARRREESLSEQSEAKCPDNAHSLDTCRRCVTVMPVVDMVKRLVFVSAPDFTQIAGPFATKEGASSSRLANRKPACITREYTYNTVNGVLELTPCRVAGLVHPVAPHSRTCGSSQPDTSNQEPHTDVISQAAIHNDASKANNRLRPSGCLEIIAQHTHPFYVCQGQGNST